jgi:peroxiredoxin
MADSAHVPASPQNVCPILVGTTMPVVTLRTADNEAFDLNDAVKQHPSVILFYRGGW